MKHLVIINLCLAVLLVLVAVRFVEQWQSFEDSHVVAEESSVAGETASAGIPPEEPGGAVQDWSVIASYNPFSFDRSDAMPEEEVTLRTGPRPFLYGTIRIGEDHLAMMAPGTATDAAAYRPVRLGQTIDGWELVEIEEKSVVVLSGGVRQTVAMNDPTARLPRTRQQPAAPQGGSVSTVGAASRDPEPRPAPAGTPPQGAARPATTSAPAGSNTRTIQTPFGTRTIQVRPQ